MVSGCLTMNLDCLTLTLFSILLLRWDLRRRRRLSGVIEKKKCCFQFQNWDKLSTTTTNLPGSGQCRQTFFKRLAYSGGKRWKWFRAITSSSSQKWIIISIIPTPTMAINVTLLQVDRVFNLYKSGDGAALLDAFVSKAEPLYRYSILSIAKLCVTIKAFVSRSLSRLPWPERRIIINKYYHEQGSVARVVGYPTRRLEKSLPRKSGGGESHLHHQDFLQYHQNCHRTLTNFYIHGNIATITIAFSYKMENNQVWTWMKQCQEDVRFWWGDKVFRGNIESYKKKMWNIGKQQTTGR